LLVKFSRNRTGAAVQLIFELAQLILRIVDSAAEQLSSTYWEKFQDYLCGPLVMGILFSKIFLGLQLDSIFSRKLRSLLFSRILSKLIFARKHGGAHLIEEQENFVSQNCKVLFT